MTGVALWSTMECDVLAYLARVAIWAAKSALTRTDVSAGKYLEWAPSGAGSLGTHAFAQQLVVPSFGAIAPAGCPRIGSGQRRQVLGAVVAHHPRARASGCCTRYDLQRIKLYKI